MKLAHYGEDRLIAEITRGLPLASDVRVGAGDDCAVIGGPRAARWLLLKTDVVLEGVHFLRNDDPRRVGWKALCRAISDVAAMGGVPEHALITIAISRDDDVSRVKALYSGLRRAARIGLRQLREQSRHLIGAVRRRVGLQAVGGVFASGPFGTYCITVDGRESWTNVP